MKTEIFALLIGVLIFISCNKAGKTDKKINNPPKYQIDLEKSIDNVNALTLSSIGKEIFYIPLETNPNCIINRINQIAINDSLIFVSDGLKLIQFSVNGNFIRQIGSYGRGPGEYTFIWDFCIGNAESLIYVLNAGSREVMIFDFFGKFIKSISLPTQQTQVIKMDSGELMFHVPNMIMKSDDTVYSWIIIDKNGTVLSRQINHLKRVNFPGFTVPLAPALYMFETKAYCMEYGIDTLYFLNKTSLEPYAIFNLGSLKMDPDPHLKSVESEELFSRKFWIYSVIEDNRNLYININWGIPTSPVSCVYNKQTAEVTFPENGRFVNDLDYGIDFWPEKIYKDSILIDYIDAFKLLDIIDKKQVGVSKKTNMNRLNKFRALKNQLTETSNPILMILK